MPPPPAVPASAAAEPPPVSRDRSWLRPDEVAAPPVASERVPLQTPSRPPAEDLRPNARVAQSPLFGSAPLPSTLSSRGRHLEDAAESRTTPRWLGWGVPVVAIAAALGSLYWNANLHQQIKTQESSVSELEHQNQALTQELQTSPGQRQGSAAPGSSPSTVAAPPAGFGPAGAGSAAETSAASSGRGGSGRSRVPAGPLTGVSHPPGTPGSAQPSGRTSSTGQASGAVSTPLSSAALAQNIATVFNIQKHTSGNVIEFHVAEGGVSRPFPDLALQVRRPDKKHGTYALVVPSGRSPIELKGKVNQPLWVARRPNGHAVLLTVLNITDSQVYGYLTESR